MADQMRGVFVPRPQWIAIDGVSDTARLVRAIAATMPPEALLNVVRPRGTVGAFVRAHALAASKPELDDFYCPVGVRVLGELAAVIERQAPEPPCAGIFVVQDGSQVVEAFRRDGGEDVVWVAAELPQPLIDRFRAALDGAHPELGPAVGPQAVYDPSAGQMPGMA
jgi:hypothetical protein